MGDYYLSTGIYELPNDLGLRIKSSPKKKKNPRGILAAGGLNAHSRKERPRIKNRLRN